MTIIASWAVLLYSYDAVYITDITRYSSHFNLYGSYSPKLASIIGKLLTVRYPAACCGEVHFSGPPKDLFIEVGKRGRFDFVAEYNRKCLAKKT